MTGCGFDPDLGLHKDLKNRVPIVTLLGTQYLRLELRNYITQCNSAAAPRSPSRDNGSNA